MSVVADMKVGSLSTEIWSKARPMIPSILETRKEGLALNALDLTEAHLGGDVVGELAGVLGDETLDGAGAVGDVEVLAILDVG